MPTGGPPDLSIDLVDLGAGLLDWSDSTVAETVATVQAGDLVVFASPTCRRSSPTCRRSRPA
jgi:FMN reductase